MQSSFEWVLLSRIVRTANLKDVLDWGIRKEDFGITTARGMFTLITGLYLDPNTSGTIPAPGSLEGVFPEFQINDNPSETTDFLCQQVRYGFLEREIKAACTTAVEEVEGDVGEAIRHVAARIRELSELGTSRNADMGMRDGMRRLLLNYEQMELGLLKPKFLWPWPIMNEMTGGVSDEDYIILYGRPKQKKSWALAYMAAFTVEQDKRVLVYTKEMTKENLQRRIVACALRLPYHEFRFGKLNPEQKKLLQDYQEYFNDPSTRAELIMLDGSEANGADTVGWIEAKVEKYQPDAVFIDGLHLLSDESTKREQVDHARVRAISRGLRQLSIRKKIPVIGTIHANRKAAAHSEGNLDEIAYSDAVAQDATVAIRTIAERHQPTMAMVMAGSREFKLDGFRINSVVAQDFTEHSVMDADDVQKVAERDAEGKLAKGSKKGKPRTTNGGGGGGADDIALGAETQELVDQHWKAMTGIRH